MVTRRSPVAQRTHLLALAAVAAAVLTSAACSSEDTDDSFGAGPPTAATTEPASPGTAPPLSTTTTEASPAATPSTDASTDNAGPLPEPTVSLFEVGTFEQPVQVTHRPGHGELFVVEQAGKVLAVTDLSVETVLDITDLTIANGERGLLGLAFHPTADLAYLNFTDLDGDTVVAEFMLDATTAQFERSSYREVLTVDQPYGNHNGGRLAFGPDQLLYIGLGDGGSGGDPERYALDVTSRLGKILRIDPVQAGSEPFSIPADNPFVSDSDADPAIWSIGLRNPWRFSFDPDTGDLWIADVGQVDFEEINRSTAVDRLDAAKGANFGWSAFEGFQPFNPDQPTDGAIEPLFVYDHADGRCSVSGGAVARGDAVADLRGWYLFGDYCTGQIWALDPTAPPTEPRVVEIAQLDTLVGIDVGPERDLYAVSNGGTISRIIAG